MIETGPAEGGRAAVARRELARGRRAPEGAARDRRRPRGEGRHAARRHHPLRRRREGARPRRTSTASSGPRASPGVEVALTVLQGADVRDVKRALHRPPRVHAHASRRSEGALSIARVTATAARLRRLLYAAAFLRALAIGLMAVLIGLLLRAAGLLARRRSASCSPRRSGARRSPRSLTMLVGQRLPERALLVALTGLPVAGRRAAPRDRRVRSRARRGRSSACSTCTAATAARSRSSSRRCSPRPRRTRTARASSPGTTCCSTAATRPAGCSRGCPRCSSAPRAWRRSTAMRVTLALFCALYVASAILYARLPARVADAAPVGAAPALAGEPADRREDLRALLRRRVRRRLHRLGALRLLLRRALRRVRGDRGDPLQRRARCSRPFSHLAAAWLAKRIGLVNTMVYTHVPSSLLLFTIVAADSFAWAAFFFLLREALNEMDVPTRQSYVMAVVKPAGAPRRGRHHEPRALGRAGRSRRCSRAR